MIAEKKETKEAVTVTKKETTYPASEVNAMKAKGQSIPGGSSVRVNADDSVTVTAEGEVSEDETDDVGDQNALGADALQNLTGQEAPHDANDMAPDGMDDDSDDKRAMMGMAEAKKEKANPWAICHAQVGPKKTRKFERCVQSVKKQLGEGKNPVSLFLENQIMKIVEKNLPPKITKGELLKYLAEAGPATAPSKPKTSPTTKPGKPSTKPRPSHPGKNPNPGEKESPKAKKVSPEQAKDEVLDLIINLLQK
jgi:copper chaperone CopZ